MFYAPYIISEADEKAKLTRRSRCAKNITLNEAVVEFETIGVLMKTSLSMQFWWYSGVYFADFIFIY